MLKTDEKLKTNCRYKMTNTVEHISYKTIVFNIQFHNSLHKEIMYVNMGGFSYF